MTQQRNRLTTTWVNWHRRGRWSRMHWSRGKKTACGLRVPDPIKLASINGVWVDDPNPVPYGTRCACCFRHWQKVVAELSSKAKDERIRKEAARWRPTHSFLKLF